MQRRPLDCSECKKDVKIEYTEIVSDQISRIYLCSDCPHLQKKLQGNGCSTTCLGGQKITASLECEHCHVSLDSLRMGHTLGCSNCYEVFGDSIIDELIASSKISKHFSANHRTQPLHQGRSPGQATEISPTLKLIALNEALDETLLREDYEQAAALRDQIDDLKKQAENDK